MRADWVIDSHPVSADSFARSAEDPELVAELDGFLAECSPGMRLLDVGANYGLFCLAAAHYGGPEARAVAVDPSSTSNRILRDNLRLAGAADRVTVIEAAAGEADGVLSMLTTGPTGDHYLVAAPSGRADVTTVKQYSLPSLSRVSGIRPTHLKIDVEGFEAEVIDGAHGWLRQVRPLVFLELHGDLLRRRGKDPVAVLNRLAGAGYRDIECHGRALPPQQAAEMPICRLVLRPSPSVGQSNE